VCVFVQGVIPIMSKEGAGEQRTIYVRKVPKGYDKEALSVVFKEFGTITRLDLPVDKATGEHKGKAFVEYQSEAEMLNAIQHFPSDKYKMVLAPYKPKPKNRRDSISAPAEQSVQPTANGNQDSHTASKEVAEDLKSHNQSGASKVAKQAGDKKKQKKEKKVPTSNSGEQKGKEVIGRAVPITPDIVYDGQEAWTGRSRSNSKASQPTEWEPNPSMAGQRPKQRYLIGQMEAGKVLFMPSRNPLGPSGDGGRGFSAGRGKILAR